MPHTLPWRLLLKLVNDKKWRGLPAIKNARMPQNPRRFSTTPSRTLLKKRSARETRQDRDHAVGILGDHRVRFLQNAS